jgi:hypothetical protein
MILDPQVPLQDMALILDTEAAAARGEVLRAPGVPVAQAHLDRDRIVLVAEAHPIFRLVEIGAAEIFLDEDLVLLPIRGVDRQRERGCDEGRKARNETTHGTNSGTD